MPALSKFILMLLLLTAVTALSGCGKKGPLYLPSPQPPKAPAQSK